MNENDLRTALRDASTDQAPTRDLLAGAQRNHRRRRATQAALGTTGTLCVVAALAITLTGGGTATKPLVTRDILDARTVAMRVADATASHDNDIEYVDNTFTMDGAVSHLKFWRDYATGSERFYGSKAAGAIPIERATIVEDGTSTTTWVYLADRTWARASGPVMKIDRATSIPCNSGQEPTPDRTSCHYTAAAIRTDADRFTLVGNEDLDGRPVVHLRDNAPSASPVNLWVDRDTYEIVRTEFTQTNSGGDWTTHSVRSDYEYLPRTPENLRQLEATVPDGYRHVAVDRG